MLHVATDGKNTLYSTHRKRGSQAIDEIGVLPDFKGSAIHDGFKTYFKYKNCKHGLCNVHHLRELTFIEEFEKEPWAKEMKAFLTQTHAVVRKMKSQGRKLNRHGVKYLQILKSGYRFHGLSEIPKIETQGVDPPKKPKQKKQKPGKNLLDRLNRFRGEVLSFIKGRTPFSNNPAEQVIRVAKVKQKISGGFRSLGGAKIFCRIRSVLSSNHYVDYMLIVEA